MRAGLPQNLAPEANANHSPARDRKERANMCLHNIDVFLSLDPSPSCRSTHGSHPNCIFSRRHGTVSLSRSFPRSFAGKLQIGDFHGSVDLRIRAIFPSAWTYFNLSAIRSWDRVQRPTLMHAVSNALWYVYQETPGGTDMSWRNLIAQSGAAQPVCLSVFRVFFLFLEY